MKRLLEKLEGLSPSPRSVPWVLLIVSFVTYGLFFWARGFYWDEAPWTYIYYRLGPAALTHTFSTSRPFWGMIYQLTMPVIGPYPWRWQLLMVVLRWLTSTSVWAILRQVWPENPRPALWASLLFLVYPGLGQNFVSLMYTHFYIVLNCFLASLYLSGLALRSPARRLLLTVASLVLAFVNLITMEYFYFLEFFRYILFWFLSDGSWKQRARRTANLGIPYVSVFLGVTFWRAFFFQNQNASYGYVNLDLIRQDPIRGILKVAGDVLSSFWETVPHAWLFPFEPVDASALGPRTTAVAFGLVFAAVLLVGMYFHLFVRPARPDRQWAGRALVLGLAAWILAGGSFWLVGIRPLLHFSSDRFTLPFMLGSSLILAALLGLLDARPVIQHVVLALLVGFSIGRQFQTNAAYIRDWDLQRDLFWQMSWRIPSLTPGTTLVTNDFPMIYFSDNSLSGPLNWIYSPPGRMDHILYFASVRADGVLAGLKPDQPFEQYYLATTFYGNTSRIVAIDFSPPGCLRVLDPEIDADNRLLPPLMREVALASKSSLIETDRSAPLPESLYSPEAPHGWCYYFEQADLAAQLGDWSRVTTLGDQAFGLNDYPNDPVERFVFIEGYAHAGNWLRVKELAVQSYRVSPGYVGPPLCKLLNRIDWELPPGNLKESSLNDLRTKISCLP
jgi:hypothetical protein